MINRAGAQQEEPGSLSGADVSIVHVHCTVETRDRDHIDELLASSREGGLHRS